MNGSRNAGRKFLVAAAAVIVLVLIVAGVTRFASNYTRYKDAYEQSESVNTEEKAEDQTDKAEDKIEIRGSTSDSSQSDSVKDEISENIESSISKDEKSSRLLEILTESDDGEMTPEEAAEKVTPSIVCIQNYQTVTQYITDGGYNFGGFSFGGRRRENGSSIQLAAEGSGIIVSQDGYIATNAHVIEGAELVKVVLSNGDIYQAEIIGSDTDTDLALLKIKGTGLPAATIGDSSAMKVGQFVLAIGNPGGSMYSNSVTFGIVSAVHRELDYIGQGYTLDMIQTDAAINPGNSGGALINLKGEVVGICSMKYVDTQYEGMGFAISSEEAIPILNELLENGRVTSRSALGITGMALDEVSADYYDLVEGMYVSNVTSDKAGDLEPGDVIIAVEGKETKTLQDLKAILKGRKPGETVEVTYYRSSEKANRTTTVTLIALDSD